MVLTAGRYLITLTIGPAFLSASIYLCLGRIVTAYGAHLSRFKPRTYTIVFVTCDIISLILQAVGGAIAADASQPDDEKLGEHIMLAGLIFQVISLVLFSLRCIDFGLRVRKSPLQRNQAFTFVTRSFKFKSFLWSMCSLSQLRWISLLNRVILQVLPLPPWPSLSVLRSVSRSWRTASPARSPTTRACSWPWRAP